MVTMEAAKSLYSDLKYTEAVTEIENRLPHLENPRVKSEAHLLLAKCHKNLNDLKAAIDQCNLSILTYSKWRDPYLFRSACFQALQTSFQTTAGDSLENIEKDRNSADVIVDPNCKPTAVSSEDDDKQKMRLLFRRTVEEKKKVYVTTIDEALRVVPSGGSIFVEKGEYEVSSKSSGPLASYFVYGKNISLIGASTAHCTLVYRCRTSEVNDFEVESKLETFLIASSSNQPTLIKRLTFRNCNPVGIKTKFLGVGGGTLQLEDCVFDGGVSPAVDAVYANAKICGQFSANHPPPYLIARYCVFSECLSYGTVTGLQSCVNINSCVFIGCGRMSVAALDHSKVTLENCEFALSTQTTTTVSSTSSDLTVSGCYFNGGQIDNPEEIFGHTNASTSNCDANEAHELNTASEINGRQAENMERSSSIGVGATVKSVVKLKNNYFYRLARGVSSDTSDITCSDNMFYWCSSRVNAQVPSHLFNPSMHTAVALRCKAKATVNGNLIKYCDVGVSTTAKSSPAIRDNVFDGPHLAAVFAEDEAKPLIVGNTFSEGEMTSMSRGVGCLFLSSSGGMVAKNSFQDFSVSPLIIFTNCHPLIRENRYECITIQDDRQAELESRLICQFQTQVEKDSYFYLIESGLKESALAEVILKGPDEAVQEQQEAN